MVSTKTPKVAKYTYAERVLGAFTQLQKDHRKHAVHLATLRAQVKKNAQVKEDRLGPRWSHWVGRAVHKLEDDGILEPTEPSGSVALTPDGKKAIHSARRYLRRSGHTAGSLTDEDHIYKQVATSRGMKRPRRSSTSTHENWNDTDDEDVTPSPIKVRNKRARSSLPRSGKKSISRMTKAELKAELESLKLARANDPWARPMSPLTDLGDNEEETEQITSRLKGVLKERENEIETLRRELAEARHQAELDGSRSENTSRFATPDPEVSFEFVPSSSLQTPMANMLAKRPLLGVTRTHSGSLIPYLSKQPTPAPTTSGEHFDDSYQDFAIDGDDVFGASQMQVDDHLRLQGELSRPALVSQSSNQLATPGSTPARQEVDHAKELDQYRILAEKRANELTALEEQLAQIHMQYSKAEQGISQRDAQISTLDKELGAVREQAARQKSLLARRDLELEALNHSIATLISENERYVVELPAAKKDLRAAQATIAECQDQAAVACGKTATLQIAIENARAELEAQKASNSQLREQQARQVDELHKERERSESLLKEVQAHSDMFAELESTVETLRSERATLGEQLEHAASDLASTSEKFRNSEVNNAALLQQLNATTNKVNELEGIQAGKDYAIDGLKKALATSNQEVGRFQTEIQTLKASIQTYEEALAKSNTTITELGSELEETVSFSTQLSSQLEEARKDVLDSIEKAKSTVKALSIDLQIVRSAAVKEAVTLQLTADELQAEKENGKRLSGALLAKDGELGDLKQQLAMIESMAGKFRQELTAKGTALEKLRLELVDTQGTIADAKNALVAAEAKHSLESAELKSTISNLQKSLSSKCMEVAQLEAQLKVIQDKYNETQMTLESRDGELSVVKDSLASEKESSLVFEKDLVAAVGKVQELEEELLDLKYSKEEDESTIDDLRESLKVLRDSHLQAIATLENKITSAHSSPMPKRRESKAISQTVVSA
ncbi:hypothetical protein BDQ12DRAFT_735898 [Crucibulum laeve]|uniref:Uncharacterized protein n=1 Tax=Crucibulum laeve TaxID=68775 RepID=A0A5C3M0W4_9AGAR|nr:hypothetical protein BDQ12DRAFT_735898 [Crucibulum laeve]